MALIMLYVAQWFVRPYEVPSTSMVPTLVAGERVFVNRLAVRFGTPEIGDILAFHPPADADQRTCGVRRRRLAACPKPGRNASDITFIKRVVAGPGDALRIVDGVPIVNGIRPDEDFTVPCHGDRRCDFPKAITIPEGHYFMMGDNRPTSEDSRFWGPIPDEWVIGEAFLSYWPLDEIGAPE